MISIHVNQDNNGNEMTLRKGRRVKIKNEDILPPFIINHFTNWFISEPMSTNPGAPGMGLGLYCVLMERITTKPLMR